MTTPAEEDRAADLARQLNENGIKTDPGVTGGVVIYATAEQAELFLASLVPAAAQCEHDAAVAAEDQRHSQYIASELNRHERELRRLGSVRRMRTGAAASPDTSLRMRGCGEKHAGLCTSEMPQP